MTGKLLRPAIVSALLFFACFSVFAVPVAAGSDPHWENTTLINNVYLPSPDSGMDARYIALGIGPDGTRHMSYFDNAKGEVIYARVRDGVATAEKVAIAAGTYTTSIAVDPVNNTPAITFGNSDHELKYAYPSGTTWSVETVDSGRNLGEYSSLAFDRNGTPNIAYNDGWHYANLKFATRSADGSWSNEVVDNGIYGKIGNTGYCPQLRITDTGAFIAYRDGRTSLGTLRYASRKNGESWEIVSVDAGDSWAGSSLGNTGYYPAFTFDQQGVPEFYYYDQHYEYLKRAVGPLIDKTFGNYDVVRDGGHVKGLFASVANKGKFGQDLDFRHLVFYDDDSGNLVYYPSDSNLAHNATFQTVDTGAGKYCAVASDPAGFASIVYYDETNHAIKLAWQVAHP